MNKQLNELYKALDKAIKSNNTDNATKLQNLINELERKMGICSSCGD